MLNKLYAILIPAALLFAACGDDSSYTEEEPVDITANANANDAGANPDLSRWEVPHTSDDNLFIAHRTNDGLMNYCLEYNLDHNHSQWVAYRYDSKLASKASPYRTDAWAADPSLNRYKEHQVAVCTFSGYNRGHLVGSAERYYSRQANEQTFYMTNMSPMQGQFNSLYWGAVEDIVRDSWGRPIASGDTLYIVKGGVLDHTLGTISVPSTAGQTIKVTVPQYYFMAVLWLRSGTLQAIGFWMEHKDYKNASDRFLSTLARNSACSIDQLEELTGLDFFCNLPDHIETQVESKYSLSLWPGI